MCDVFTKVEATNVYEYPTFALMPCQIKTWLVVTGWFLLEFFLSLLALIYLNEAPSLYTKSSLNLAKLMSQISLNSFTPLDLLSTKNLVS